MEMDIAEKLIKMMNVGQKNIIDTLRNLIITNGKTLIFIDGPGGTGKSFVLHTIYHLARANRKNVCNMAFSGIAATALKGGRTLHNRFKLPLNIKQNSTSGVEIGDKDAEEIKKIDLFIWDEAPMAPRFVLEIVDRKLKEIMNNKEPFGGNIMILSGDFRQCFPIKDRDVRWLARNKGFWPRNKGF